MPTLKIHKKSRFQPNEEIFAESCLVRYKDLFRAKKIWGVIGTLILHVTNANRLNFHRINSLTFKHPVSLWKKNLSPLYSYYFMSLM